MMSVAPTATTTEGSRADAASATLEPLAKVRVMRRTCRARCPMAMAPPLG